MNLLVFIIFFILASAGYGCMRGAPWLPTRRADLERMIECAEIKSGEVVYDLGCGDGRVLFAAADRGARAIGFEVFLAPYIYARLRHLFSKKKKFISIHWQDFFFANISNADVVYVFLLPEFYEKIKNKLEKELKRGARVVVHMWPIDGWEPTRINRPPKQFPIFIYER